MVANHLAAAVAVRAAGVAARRRRLAGDARAATRFGYRARGRDAAAASVVIDVANLSAGTVAIVSAHGGAGTGRTAVRVEGDATRTLGVTVERRTVAAVGGDRPTVVGTVAAVGRVLETVGIASDGKNSGERETDAEEATIHGVSFRQKWLLHSIRRALCQ